MRRTISILALPLVVVLAVLATVVLERQAWRRAPRSATAVGRLPLEMRPM